ncbi:MAG: DNA (cytosine-5-)-methyltransferase [Candidatus Cloacimonetes bacterium HGW-Cloacimonetes-1]|jgi:DNA (cytosine-5)-methyltransferase 1|nr:MAG: DNA (cytosine-5-)-methyltransferase [Candidatus Cloacimonetes bacterium HGW-Cloacimonetes-1]
MGIKLLSFFTGAGFLDLGFIESGFDIIWHNEYHKPFVRIYEYGMKSMGFVGRKCRIQNTSSIVDVGASQISLEAFGMKSIPEIFGVIGGPPCPDFSVGGKNRGGTGNNGQLLKVYLERIAGLKPTFFLLENVPGLVKTHKHRQYLIDSLLPLSSHYAIDFKILNALDFGVPQDRERVFIIGFEMNWLKLNQSILYNRYCTSPFQDLAHSAIEYKDIKNDNLHWYPWPENLLFKNKRTSVSWPDKPVPKGSVPIKPNAPSELMVYTYICDENLKNLPNSKDYFTPKSKKFTELLEGDVSKKSFKKLHRYRYSPAAAYGNNEVHLHCCLPRRLSVREALRIQSIPDNYIMPDEITLTDKFKAVGNGVPAKLAKAVAESLKLTLTRRINESI